MAQPIFKKIYKNGKKKWVVNIPLSYLEEEPQSGNKFKVKNRFGELVEVILDDLISNDSRGAFFTFHKDISDKDTVIFVSTVQHGITFFEYIKKSFNNTNLKFISIDLNDFYTTNNINIISLKELYYYIIARQILLGNGKSIIYCDINDTISMSEFFIKLGLDKDCKIIITSGNNDNETLLNIKLGNKALNSHNMKTGVWISLHSFIRSKWISTLIKFELEKYELLLSNKTTGNSYSRIKKIL